MAELTVANYLAALQDDPWDQSAMEGLQTALSSGDPKRTGDDPVRLLEFARRNHEVRGENFAAAKLMSFEVSLVSGDPDFAAVLYRELGRVRREELMDDAGAREAYRSALELRPGDEEVERALEQIAQVSERWQEISSHFITQAEQASEASLRTSLLLRAASIIWQYKKKGRSKEVDRLFQETLATDPASARAVRLYELTLRERNKWAELGTVLLGVAEQTESKDERLGLFLGAARVFVRRLDDPSRAAACYERVLELAPAHEEALNFLVAHFTEQKEWEHLVAVYEDALRARQLKADAEQGILLQIAMVHWRMLERTDRAEPYFARVRKSDPAQPVMLDFYRERYTASGENNKLLAVLSDAQRRVESEAEKARFALEIARLAQHDAQSAERAIDAFKLVLRHEPLHEEAGRSLKELYRRSGKWNALVELLRSELDMLPEGDTRSRLLLLKEMLVIYRDELELDATVLSTYNAILQLDPADREATLELAKTYEAMGRYNDLIPVLLREAESEGDSTRKIELYLRVARLWVEHFSNFNQATAPLEHVLELDPAHPEALMRLREIYGKKRAWQKLSEVLAKQEELAPEGEAKRALLLELASLVGERLHDYPRAIGLYKRLLALDPRAPGVLDSLEKLAERAKDWDTLAEVLEQRASELEEFTAKTKLLMRLGTLHSERTQKLDLAAQAWKRVLELDPKNGRALRTLREAYLAAGDFASVESLYAEAGDWEGFVDVLGSAADRAPDPEHKKALSFRAAEVYERELKEPARAFRSYERVLALDPENERAVRALLPIYEKDDKWPRVAQLNEILLAKLKGVKGADARKSELELELRLTELFQTKLRDGERAFVHASAAYQLAPGDERVQKRVESAAELASAHERLVALYVARAEQSDNDEAIGLRRRVAQIWTERLKRPEQAAAQLELILNEQPHDEAARTALERIYRSTGRGKELAALYTRMLDHARNEHERAALLRERARIEEELLADADAAIESYRALHALKPDDRPALATLDKLLSAKARHAELLPVLEARVALSEERSKERVELLLRLGKLANVELLDSERAIVAFTGVLESEPSEPRAVEQLEQIADTRPNEALRIGRLLEPVYERTAKLDKLVRVLKRRLETTLDGDERRMLRLRLAEIEGSLGDPKSAYATLESAFLDNPQNTELWDRISHVAEKAEAIEELAVAFSTAIEMAELAPGEVAALSARTARIYDEALGQSERAEPFYKRVLAFDPLDEVAYQGLRELYTTNDRWDELKQLYRERIEHTVEPAQRLELLLQVCFLYEEILDDVDMAIQSYEAVLELSPSHPTSRRALERLYTRAGRLRELVGLLEADRAESHGKEAIELTYRIGELYEHKLNEPSPAVDQYASVLEAQPTHLRAQEALSRLIAVRSERQRIAGLLEPVYVAQGAHAELAKVLEVQLEQLTAPGARVAVLLRLGELRERELRDIGGAYLAYARAVEAEPADAHARSELARVASLAGKVKERGSLLEEALTRAAETRTRIDLLRELAEIYHYGLADVERALATYTRLIQVDPSDPEVVPAAARALERLHADRGEHAALAEDLRLQINFESDSSEKSGLLLRLAELSERELHDVPRAIEAYVERLDLDPADFVTLTALERLYEAQRDYPRLIGILQRRDAASTDEAEARLLARRVGEIYERELKDSENALSTYHDVLARFGNDRTTLQALQRVYEAGGRHQELLEVVTQELELTNDVAERAALGFRAAELMRKHTGAAEAALEAYRSVLEEQPAHPGTLAALSELVAAGGPLRIEAARLLAPQFTTLREHERLLGALDVLAESDDARERLDALKRASQVAERELNDAERAYRFSSRALRSGLDELDLSALLDDVERLARSARAQRDYVALLQEVAPGIADEELSLRMLMSAATVARDELSEPAEARALFERALTIRPDYRAALDALERLHEQAEDYRGLWAVLVQKTELASEPAERTRLLLRQAELAAGKLDDVPRAIDAYERLLDEAPTPAVFAGLEALYQRASRFTELGSMYERQLELRVGDAVLVHFNLAELSRTRRGDVERALDLYREVLERSPLHEGARQALEALMDDRSHRARAAELLEPLYLRSERWPELARALEAQIENEESGERKKELLGRLAQLHEVQLEDLESALDMYARVFRVDPNDVHVSDALTRLARVLGKQLRVAEIYESYLDEVGVHDALGVRLAVSAAQIREQFGRDLERATQLYQRALSFDPTARSLADALEKLLSRRGAHDELRSFFRAQADIAVEEPHRLILLRKLASVTERELGDVEAAIRVQQEIVELAPRDRDANGALDRLLGETKRWSDLADHLRHQIDQAAGSGLEVDLKLRLADLLEHQIDEIDLAIDTYEEIARLAPDNAAARAELERLAERPELRKRVAEILEPLYAASNGWSKQVWLTEKLVEIQPDAAERAELLRRIARLQEQQGKLPRAALEANRRALVTYPSDSEARAEVERLAAKLGDWDALVAALEEGAQATNDDELKASLLLSVARTHDEKRGDPRSAIQAYERLIQTDTDDVAAYEQLEALLTMVGDWTGLVNLLNRKVERSYDPEERAQLLRRAGSVLDELIGDVPGAIRAYNAALEEVDDDAASLASLDDLYTRVEDHAALAEVLRRRADLVDDSEERISVNMRLGAVLAERLGRPRKAIDAYGRALDDDPTRLEALVALGKLYAAESMWSELLDNLRRQLDQLPEATADQSGGTRSTRLGLLYAMGQVRDEHLSEFEEAVESYSEALALEAGHEPSIRALMRIGEQVEYRARVEEILEPILRDSARWDDLATLLSRGVGSLVDVVDRQARLLRLAEIHERGRNDLAAAFDAVCEALIQDVDEPRIPDEVERLAGLLSTWDRAADVLAHRASKTADAEFARELYRRVARISERELSDVARTIQTYELALSRGGDDESMLAELDRLYTASEGHQALADVIERRVPYASDADASALLVRLGELREQRFGDAAAALECYRDALERTPGDAKAVASLERLLQHRELAGEVVELLERAYRDSGELSRVASLYETRAELADSQPERARLLSELATLYESDLRDHGKAAETLRRAFEADSSDFGLLDEIERVAHAAARFDVLAGLVEAAVRRKDLASSDRRDLWMRAAAWYRDRIADPAKAEQALRHAIEIDSEYEPAHEALVALLRGEGRHRDLVEALFVWADRESDRVIAAERFTEAAVIAETAAGQSERAIEAYDRVLAIDPGQLHALDALIRIYEASGKLGRVAQLYERRIEAEADTSARVELRHRAARLRAERLEDRDGAIRLELTNLDDDPTNVVALNSLEQLYEGTERWAELAELLGRRLELAESSDERTRVRVRLALIAEQRLGDRARAIEELREIVIEMPNHEAANEALERLLEAEGRWQQLVEQLERRTDLAREAGDDTQELALLVRLGELVEQRLDDRARASEFFERVREREPKHAGALRALARLYLMAGEPARAADLLDTLLGELSGSELVDASYALAEISERMAAPERTEAALKRALTAGLRERETRTRLLELYERTGAHAELASLLAEEAERSTDSAQQVSFLRRGAELFRDKLKDPSRAADLLKRASELVPDDRSVLVPLCELYIAAGRQSDAVPVLEKIVASYGGRRVKDVAMYRRMLAQAYSGLGDKARALSELDAAYRIDLTNVGVLADLGLLAFEQGDYERAQKTFRGLLLQKLDRDAPISKADVYFYLGDISSRQGDAPKAISMLERALAEQSSHERARKLLASLKG